MAFLRRLLGSGGQPRTSGDRSPVRPASADLAEADLAAPRLAGADIAEAERNRELLDAEATRLDDELLQRQLRYASRSWTPPAQGGEARASLGDGPGRD